MSFAAPNKRKTPHIKGKKMHKKNYVHPNAADFQLKKKEQKEE